MLSTGEPEKLSVKEYKKVSDGQSLVTVVRRLSEMEAKHIEILIDIPRRGMFIKSVNWVTATALVDGGGRSSWLNGSIGLDPATGAYMILRSAENRDVGWTVEGVG